MHTHTHICTGWRRLIGSPKLQIMFHERATKYRSFLRKMTYKDKGSYESSPPCSSRFADSSLGCLFSLLLADENIFICIDTHTHAHTQTHTYTLRWPTCIEVVQDVYRIESNLGLLQTDTDTHTHTLGLFTDRYIHTHIHTHTHI